MGAGSPGVTVAESGAVFYAGRGPADPAGPFEHSMNRADLEGRSCWPSPLPMPTVLRPVWS